ncbi:MAG: protein TolA [Alphaproteobacteria bacterium]|nr:protein TolA [Alphaproteobacteria bacterium]
MQAIGLIVSVLFHGALLGWAAFELLGTAKLPEPAAPTIEAEIITIAEFTKLKKGDPEAKQLVAKATPEEPPQVTKKLAPKPKPPKPAPPPTPTEATLPEPTPPKEPVTKAPPPPKPDDIAKKIDSSVPPVPAPQSDAAARKKKAEIQRKYKEKLKKQAAARRKKEAERKKKLAEKKRKAKKKKQEDFTKRMAALLDKTPEERGSKRSGTSQDTDYSGPTAGEREGQGDQLTAREEDLLKGRISAQIRDCWRLPGGGGGIDTTVVKVRWRLKKSGALDGQPQVVGRRNDRLFQVAGDAAVRAVLCAAPFDLPRDMYSAWQEITWEFDPRAML